MARKTRITKEEIIAYREDKKIPSYKRKKDIKPGPWTNLEVDFEVKAKFRFAIHVINTYGETCGSYKDDYDWGEKGWYPIVFNITTEEDIQELVKKHGLDKVVAACENSLCEAIDEEGKRKFGDVIILNCMDNSQREDPLKRYFSCHGKTNKKSIPGFMASRAGEYKKL